MKRFALAIALMAVGLAGFGGASLASSDPPGRDPCSHGHTGKPCREDPQPDHGKDCDHHGNHGGVNEDHCKGETTDTTHTETTHTETTETTVTTGTTGETITVPTTPGETVTVTGPATVATQPGAVTVTPTKPGIVEVDQPGKRTRIGVPARRHVPEALTG